MIRVKKYKNVNTIPVMPFIVEYSLLNSYPFSAWNVMWHIISIEKEYPSNLCIIKFFSNLIYLFNHLNLRKKWLSNFKIGKKMIQDVIFIENPNVLAKE